jgi:hypothetical protein
MGLSFTIAAGPHQRSHSEVRVPWDSRPHFTVSDSRLSKPGWTGPRVYIHQEQGCPVIPRGTGFPATLRATVEVFDPASTRDQYSIGVCVGFLFPAMDRIENIQEYYEILLCIVAACAVATVDKAIRKCWFWWGFDVLTAVTVASTIFGGCDAV